LRYAKKHTAIHQQSYRINNIIDKQHNKNQCDRKRLHTY